MTMPPFTEDPETSRPYFARLAELAGERGLERLSMGTSQDWRVGGGGGGDDHPPRLGALGMKLRAGGFAGFIIGKHRQQE